MQKRIFHLLVIIFLLTTPLSLASDYDNHWAKEQIQAALEKNLASGTSEGTFEPDRNITRCEYIHLLVRYADLKTTSFFSAFNDVHSDSWYFPAIVTAETNGIIKGYEDGGFHPFEPITREDAITFFCRAYNLEPSLNDTHFSYSDLDDISDYAKNYIYYALKNGIISGYQNNVLKPKNFVTRAEAVVMLNQSLALSASFEKKPEFIKGYPKISSKSTINHITVEIKTNIPCNIYYKAVKNNIPGAYLTPKKNEINQFFATASIPNSVLTSNIVLDSFTDEYNLYFIAVADHGAVSKVERIKDARALVYTSGNGSIDNPYMIYDQNQLDYMRYCQNKHFKLANDITLTKSWTPIDASDGYFGSLDGNGHLISGLNIKDNATNSGFFSVIKSGVIKNLAIDGQIESKNNAGLFAGKSEGSIISNCTATGYVKANANNAGGFVGINNGIIVNSLSALYKVESVAYAGGFAGSGNGSITNSLSAAHSVLSDMYAGGIIGVNNAGKIKNCLTASLNIVDFLTYNSGRITTNKENGITINNYSYKDANSAHSGELPGADSINGLDISWDKLTQKKFYTDTLEWDFYNEWTMPNKEKDVFILPVPKVFDDIHLSAGPTPYAPVKINTPQQLKELKNDYHYLLTGDITYNDYWIYSQQEENTSFNGSFDGNGFTIYGINIPYSESRKNYSIFGNISDGMIRNLNLYNVSIEGIDSAAVLANTNYGTIENCKIQGIIKVDQVNNSVSCGGISAINYGIIENCESNIHFIVRGNATTVGGIASHNEGFINHVSYIGNISVSTKGLTSTTAVGGIVGFNNEGFIYNGYADPKIETTAYTNYAGGICGILNSGEIFKTSSTGNIKTLSQNTAISTAYTGGICGLSASGLIVNSFTDTKINTTSTINYSGGITGFNSYANIQNNYTLNTISQTGGSFNAAEKIAFAGGILGYNESGFISDNVAINPSITSNGEIRKIGNAQQDDYFSNNYAYQNSIAGDQENTMQNGTSISLNEVYNTEFFFLPLSEGGKLGWSSAKYEENDAVWNTPSNYLYKLPVLNGVKYQTNFTIPKEFKFY